MGVFQGKSLGVPGRSGEGFGFSRGPPDNAIILQIKKNTQKSQTSCFAQWPRQRGSVSACRAPPTPQPWEGAGPELLPARPSPVLLTQAGQPGSERGRIAGPGLAGDGDGWQGGGGSDAGQGQLVSPGDTREGRKHWPGSPETQVPAQSLPCQVTTSLGPTWPTHLDSPHGHSTSVPLDTLV